MPNKRFLGLGFSFAATDKGLLKHLKAVNSTIDSINEGLKNIEASSEGASSALSGMKTVRKRRGVETVKKSASPKTTRLPPSQRVFVTNKKAIPVRITSMPQAMRAFAPTTRQEVLRPTDQMKPPPVGLTIGNLFETALKENDKKFIETIKDAMGPDLFQGFIGSLEKGMKVPLTEAGDLTKSFREKLSDLSTSFVKAQDETSKFLDSFEKFFVSVKGYLSDVAGKTKTFFSTLGVDLESIIPPQLKALGGLLGSIISPIIGLPKKIFKMFFKTKTEKLQKRLSNQIGGPGTGNNTVYGVLKKILSVQKKDKEKEGFFSKLKGALGKFAAGALGLLGLKKLFQMKSPVKSLVNFFKSGKVIETLISPLKKLFSVFKGIAKTAGVAYFAFEIFGSALKGVWEGLKLSLDSWPEFFTSLKNFGSALKDLASVGVESVGVLFDKFTSWFDNLRKNSAVVDTVATGVEKVFGLVEKFFDTISEGWKKLVANIPLFGKILSDELTASTMSATASLKQWNKEQKRAEEQKNRPRATQGMEMPKRNLEVIASNKDEFGQEQTELMQSMVNALERSNAIQSQILGETSKKNGMSSMERLVRRAAPRTTGFQQNEMLSSGIGQ